MKQVIIAILVVVGIIGGAVVFGKDKNATGAASNHIYGKADSTVKLVEFGDFECPACSAFYPVVEQVKEKYKDKISFQFVNFPLVNSHRNALAAHRAAEAASKQDKFWEMYNKLYSNQEDWNGPSQSDPVGATTEQAISLFEGYATELGLDAVKFKADFADATTVETINKDTADAKSAYDITGTPTFALNGKKIENLTSINTLEGFSAVIDATLASN